MLINVCQSYISLSKYSRNNYNKSYLLLLLLLNYHCLSLDGFNKKNIFKYFLNYAVEKIDINKFITLNLKK
jgi:hypothetical protein